MFVILMINSLSSLAARNPFVLNQMSHMQTAIILPIHYAKANELAKFLTRQHGIVSKLGHTEADLRTNQLWVKDDSQHVTMIRQLVHKLDIPVAQVLIKARIVSVDEDCIRSLGVIFGTSLNQKTHSRDFNMDMPSLSGGTGVLSLPVAKLGNGRLLDLELTALEQEGHAEVISSPELMASNRQTAVIESGEEVPYQEKTGQGNTSIAFKKATLRLKVMPIVMPGNRILLHLTVNQDKISSLLVNGVPAIRTQQLTTQVLMSNKSTVVLGGIYEHVTSHQETGIPGLRKIPVFGALFRQRRQVSERRQLLIFVTPKVMY